MPCIIFFRNGEINNRITPAATGSTAKMPKKCAIEYSVLILSISPPNWPPTMLAIADDANHKPKINPMNFLGESLETYDKPTGERQSSPVVWKKYAKISQTMLTEAVA